MMSEFPFVQVHAESYAYFEDAEITNLTINPGETLGIAGFATVTVTETIENYGTITVGGVGTLKNQGVINNHNGGLINVLSTLDNQPGAVINNTGGIIRSSGVIDNKGIIENSGTSYKLATISLTFNFLQNSGTINNKPWGEIKNLAEIKNLVGGTIINFDNAQINSNYKSIDNQGTIINHCYGSISPFIAISGNEISHLCKPPIARDDEDILVSNGPKLYNVTKGDEDYFGKGLKIISVTTPNNGGKAGIINNSILYDPKDGFKGKEYFSYVVEDGNGQKSKNGQVIIDVLNSRPLASNDFARTFDFQPIVIHVLENDKDPNQDTLSISSVGNLTRYHPWVLVLEDDLSKYFADNTVDAIITTDGKTITYTPKKFNPGEEFWGLERFEYVVVDNKGASDKGVVIVQWIGDTIVNQRKTDPRFTSYAVDWVGGQRVDVLEEFKEFLGLVPKEKLETAKRNLEDKIESVSVTNKNWDVDFMMNVEVYEIGKAPNEKEIERWHFGPQRCYDHAQVGDTIPVKIYGEFIDEMKSTNTWDSESTTPKTGKTVGFYKITSSATSYAWDCPGDSSKESVTTTPTPESTYTGSVPPNRISKSEHGHMTINERKFNPTRIEETEVKLAGQIESYKYGTVVMLEIIKPDGTIVEKGFAARQDGTFDIKISLDETWEPGRHIVRTKYNENQIGTFSIEIDMQRVPTWIKSNAKWWAENQIDDSTFVQGIQFLIKENIIIISGQPSSQEVSDNKIPSWIKNNAGWWADGKITDNDFVRGIQYLVEHGIIKV